MIVSNMSVPLMGLADTAMLGHLESPVFLGAVAIGSNIIALLYWMFAFLRMGTTSITAQAIGAQQSHLALLHLSQNTVLAIVAGLVLIVLQSLIVPFALWLIAPEQALMTVARDYCQIRIYSAPAVLITYVAMGWLIGLKKPKIPLAITVLSNLLNVGLDYLFIVHWQMDARGAAIATLIAEYVACLGSLLCIGSILKRNQWPLTQWFDLTHLRHNLSLNANLFIRTLALMFAINFFNAQSAQFGNDVLAANAILLQCVLFVAFFLDGYALAAETMTAQAIGARNQKAFHEASAVTSLSAIGITLLLSSFFFLFGNVVIDLLTSMDHVATTAKQHMPWLIIMPLVSVWCYALDGIFVGAGQARIMRNSMLFSLILGFIPFWWLLRFLDNHGLWLAFIIFNGYRGISLAFAYYRLTRQNNWLNKTK